MLKASSLSFVIVISLIIAIICSTIILQLYYYKIFEIKASQNSRFLTNIESGTNIILQSTDSTGEFNSVTSINNVDTIEIGLAPWGIYDIGTVKTYNNLDTIKKTFSIGYQIDSSKWGALHMPDEDRPIAIAGKTAISGNVFLPLAGLKAAYINNISYTGKKKLVDGVIKISDSILPALLQQRIKQLEKLITGTPPVSRNLLRDSINNSFFNPALFIKVKEELSNRHLTGKIVLYSDSTIVVDSTAHLENVIVVADTIKISEGFIGRCQLFATSAIVLEKNCTLNYPSVAGILHIVGKKYVTPPRLEIGDGCIFNGTLFSFARDLNTFYSSIIIGQRTLINGQIYAQGYLSLDPKGITINGGVFCRELLVKDPQSILENYLINAVINAKALSPDYLSSALVPHAGKNRRILQWLN